MAYSLTSDLITGNPAIDSQHRQLIDAINDLLSACAAGKGRAELEKTTTFLYDYTSRHFSDEEKLQVQYHYPEYQQHHRYHEEFKKVVRDLCGELQSQGATVALVGKVNSAIAGWLLNHIKREDKKLAEYIKSRG